MNIRRTIQDWYEVVTSKSGRKWLDERRKIDDIDGLWRIHDSLYDVSSFVDKHPGGQFWLEETKGLDVTEAFESHHVKSDTPEILLQQFFVKKANKPRVSQYTLLPNDFYKTLKKRARNVIETLPEGPLQKSKFYTDVLLLSTFAFACLANAYSMHIFTFFGAITGNFLITAAHNYCHQRDNFRMYYSNFFLFPASFSRVMHNISHHIFPNSYADLQLQLLLPFVNVFPVKKSIMVKYFALLSSLIIVFHPCLLSIGVISILESLVQRKKYENLILPLALPAAMYFTGGNTLLSTILMWQIFIIATGFTFGIFGFTSTHVHPDLYMEGDSLRPQDQLDWGIAQLDSLYDRKEIVGRHFLVLVFFGDHAIHHLFPTLDHGHLKYLYPVLEETLKDFNMKGIKLTTTVGMVVGFFKQAGREVKRSVPLTF